MRSGQRQGLTSEQHPLAGGECFGAGQLFPMASASGASHLLLRAKLQCWGAQGPSQPGCSKGSLGTDAGSSAAGPSLCCLIS